MRFKDTIQLLDENDKFVEVKGTVIPYKDGIINIDLLVHMSINAWTPDVVEVSEKETGCRLFSLKQSAKDLKPTDVVQAVTDFIKEKGKKPFYDKVKEKVNYVNKLRLDSAV